MKSKHEEREEEKKKEKEKKAKQNLAAQHFKDISQCSLYQKSYNEHLTRGGRGKAATIFLLD